jgi:hypothetical protein
MCGGEEMTRNTGAGRKFVTRCLAVATMLGLYCLAALAVSGFMLSATVTPAAAQRGGGRGGGGRGGGGRGGGVGIRGGGVGIRGGGVRGGVVRGGVVRGGGFARGRGRGRGIWRGGIWYPWYAPGICIHPYTGFRVPCPFY